MIYSFSVNGKESWLRQDITERALTGIYFKGPIVLNSCICIYMHVVVEAIHIMSWKMLFVWLQEMQSIFMIVLYNRSFMLFGKLNTKWREWNVNIKLFFSKKIYSISLNVGFLCGLLTKLHPYKLNKYWSMSQGYSPWRFLVPISFQFYFIVWWRQQNESQWKLYNKSNPCETIKHSLPSDYKAH